MLKKIISVFTAIFLLIQTASCGYILHPERRGQKSGEIDYTVAAMDSIGLLFFIIPGVIAFSIDIVNGTIYLPKGQKNFSNIEDSTKIVIGKENLNKYTIKKAIENHLGISLNLEAEKLYM